MLPPAEAIAFGRWNIDLIDAGAKGNALSLCDKIIILANHNRRFAFAISLKTKPHFPTSNPLSLDEWVGRYVEVLNPYSISTPAFKPTPISLRAADIRGAGDQQRP